MQNSHMPPTAVIIFGGAGDLAHRKLVPALYNLYLDRVLPDTFVVLALDRLEMSDDDLRRRLRDGVNQFSRRGAAMTPSGGFRRARAAICRSTCTKPTAINGWPRNWPRSTSRRASAATQIFYLAVPPTLFGPISKFLGSQQLTQDRRSRVVVEKPFWSRSALGPRAESHAAAKLPGGADLPHRSFPRQGNGAEHPGLPFRQRCSSRSGIAAMWTT